MTVAAGPAEIQFELRGPLAIATLDREPALNSLSLPMCRALLSRLEQWRRDDRVTHVLLRGAGPRAFCAGGDVKAVCQRLRAGDQAFPAEYFEAEYRLDHALHVFPKPVVAIGHGFVFGGGMGLFAGARLRVVTDSTALSMPEVSIGFFPDVGATYFLNRLPGRLGLFMALTGAQMNAGDALKAGLADLFVPDAELDGFVDGLAGAPTAREARAAAARFASSAPPPRLLPHLAAIDAALSGDDAHAALGRLLSLQASTEPLLAEAARTLAAGSPTSALVICEQLRRGRGLSLADCFRMEMTLAAQCARHHDFAEGVRALLIDKDRRPRWNPAELSAVPANLVNAHFDALWPADEHPLRDL